MLIFSVALCPAQVPKPIEPAAKVVQKFEDGSYLVEIDGVRFRALTADQLRTWAKSQVDLETCQKDSNELAGQLDSRNQQIELLRKDVVIAGQERDSALKDLSRSKEDTERAREDARRNFGLLMGERQLRIEAQQFIPHGNVKGFAGKVLNFLDGPYGQATFKLVIPAAQFIKVMRQ